MSFFKIDGADYCAPQGKGFGEARGRRAIGASRSEDESGDQADSQADLEGIERF
jgi:hypothetical protein